MRLRTYPTAGRPCALGTCVPHLSTAQAHLHALSILNCRGTYASLTLPMMVGYGLTIHARRILQKCKGMNSVQATCCSPGAAVLGGRICTDPKMALVSLPAISFVSAQTQRLRCHGSSNSTRTRLPTIAGLPRSCVWERSRTSTRLSTAPSPSSSHPLPEQRAIAAVLDSIDNAIERTEAVIAATERLCDALLHDLLTRGVPGWHTEWRDVPGLGMIPASWDVVRLGDVAEVRNGTTPSRARLDYWHGDEVPFVKTGQVNDVFIVEPNEFITSQAVTAGAVVVPKSSVLIAMIGQGKTRGMTARLGFDAAINQNFAAVYGANEDFSLEFFFAWARHNYSVIRALGQGSNQDALNCALIQGMRVPKPPVAEQRAIATMLDGVDDAIKRAHEERSGLQSLKASASDALLSGQVRVLVRTRGEPNP